VLEKKDRHPTGKKQMPSEDTSLLVFVVGRKRQESSRNSLVEGGLVTKKAKNESSRENFSRLFRRGKEHEADPTSRKKKRGDF